MNTRRLTAEEIDEAMKGYPRPMKREPVIRIRHVFVGALIVGLISALLILDPVAKLVEWIG